MSKDRHGGHRYAMNLIVLRHDGHTLDATLLRLGRLTWGAPNTRAVECEDGEDEQQNKNDGRALHLILGCEKIM